MPASTARPSPFGVPWLRQMVRKKTRYVGIDVGIDQVRVATFGIKQSSARSHDDVACSWLSQSEFQLPIDPQSPPPRNWVDLVVECLEDRLPRCVDGERNDAVVSLPIPWVHYQTATESDIATSQSQCDAMFTSSIFQSPAHLTNWRVTSETAQYVIAATAESAACRIAGAITSVGYRVQNILPHGVALLMAAPSLTTLKTTAVLMLELAGSLVAMRNEHGCGLCRNLPACESTNSENLYLDQIEPWLADIASELDATCRYVERLSGSSDNESPILLCGRAAQIQGVDEALASMLGRPVAAWRYVGRTRPHNHQTGTKGKSLDASLAVSLSLAYCGIPGACPALESAP